MRKMYHHGHEHGGLAYEGHPYEGQDKTLVLLNYTYEHNVHHTEEFTELIHELREDGRELAAEKLAEAQKLLEQGNELVHEALHLAEKTPARTENADPEE